MKLSGKVIAFTFVGGFVGTSLRYLLDLIPNVAFVNFWVVNLLGAIAIAIFNELAWFNTPERRALFVSGFAGGFTTMSGLTMLLLYAWQQVVVQLVLGVAIYLITRRLMSRFSRA